MLCIPNDLLAAACLRAGSGRNDRCDADVPDDVGRDRGPLGLLEKCGADAAVGERVRARSRWFVLREGGRGGHQHRTGQINDSNALLHAHGPYLVRFVSLTELANEAH